MELPNALSRYEPLQPLGVTPRFKTFKGEYEGEPIFVKVAAEASFEPNLRQGIVGLASMRQLDSTEAYYRVPEQIAYAAEYIVESWIEGQSMRQDFIERKADKLSEHLETLTDLFVYLDGLTNLSGVRRYNEPGKDHFADILSKLDTMQTKQLINSSLVTKTADFIRGILSRPVATRFAHGDLQPGNILLMPGEKPAVVDFESCSFLWPRHYNAVNFTFNYYWMQDLLTEQQAQDFMHQYFERLSIKPADAKEVCNLSAAMRCMQILYEQGSALQPEERLDAGFIEKLEATMRRISASELYLD